MLRTVCWLALPFALLFGPGRPADAGISAVWANDGGDKVTRDELRAGTGAAGVLNSVWDGKTINLFAARNEVVAFNLVLEASTTAASSVSVSFNRLTGPGGATISSAPASGDGVFNWVNRDIELFYLRYLPIHGLSVGTYETYDERLIPRRLQRPWTGDGVGSGTWNDRPDHDKYYPEICVPLELVPTFNIAAGQNQGIWTDIYIPRAAPNGIYTGMVTIQENGATTHQAPVSLRVANFSLPDTPACKTMVYFSADNMNYRYFNDRYPNPGSADDLAGSRVRQLQFQLAHRHRVSLIDDNCADEGWTADQPCSEWVPRLNGSLFTAQNGYDGPGVGVGNDVFSIGTYGSWSWRNGTEQDMWNHTNSWANWFTANSPLTEYFLYLIDESSNYPQTEQWASWILNNPGPGKNVRSMATIPLPTAAANTPSLDIPTSTMDVGITSQWQSAADRYTSDPRKRFYMYNAHRPASGTFATEDDGIALRELAWGQYKKHVNRWFFWESTYYDDYQNGSGETNVFEQARTFGGDTRFDSVLGRTGNNYANGDGVLFYPGTDTLYTQDSYGVKGPLVSVRLKEWRRGIQDVDYLSLAAAINPAGVQQIVNQMVPKALWEYGVTDPNDPTYVHTDISWPTNPDAWETARAELADIIERGSAPDIATGADNRTRVLKGSLFAPASVQTFDDSGTATNGSAFGPYAGYNARAMAAGMDGLTRLLWNKTDGAAALWTLGPANTYVSYAGYGPYLGWTALDLAVGSDNKSRLLWTNLDGTMECWSIDSNGGVTPGPIYGPYAGWSAGRIAAGSDGLLRVLWTDTSGTAALWQLGLDNQYQSSFTYGPYTGWTVSDIAVGSDNRTRILWTNTNGSMTVWSVDSAGHVTPGPVNGPYAGWTANRISCGADGLTRVLWYHRDGSTLIWLLNADNTYRTSHSL